MADPIQDLSEKIDALTGIVRYGHTRSEARFDSIEGHFSELREYIDFGLFKLREETEGFSHETRLELKADIARLERKLDQFIDSQLRE